MSKPRRDARRTMMERRGAVPQSTIISRDSSDLLLTTDSVRTISGIISRSTKRKLTRGNVKELVKFIRNLPSRNYNGISLKDAQELIAEQFQHRLFEKIREEEDVAENIHLTEITDEPSLAEYQQAELNQLTTDENQQKLTAYHNRRGNAVVDRERVRQSQMMGERASVNNLLAGKSKKEAELIMYKEILRAQRSLNRFLNPENIGELFNRNSTSWTTFNTISLPHQTVPLDSRYRLPTHTPVFEYKWNVHTAGVAGHLGDIRIQDTLQQVIFMKICPFHIPVTNIDHGYYGKIRMLIREFDSQSIQSTAFTKDCRRIIHNHHFEFNIVRRDINRFYLEPCNDGIFIFRKPMAQVNTITISFTAPFEQILPDADRAEGVIADHLNPAVFTTPTPHNLATGDKVYIESFESGDTAIDKLVNRDEGYIITRINDTQFSIPVDLTPLGAGTTENVCVFFGSKRLIIPIEFISLEQ